MISGLYDVKCRLFTGCEIKTRASPLPFHSSTVCSRSSSCLSVMAGGGFKTKQRHRHTVGRFSLPVECFSSTTSNEKQKHSLLNDRVFQSEGTIPGGR